MDKKNFSKLLGDSTKKEAENDSAVNKTRENACKEFAIEKNDNSNTNEKAEIYNLIIVDESGSMSHLKKSTISGVNEVIGTIRQAQEEYIGSQQHFLTIVTFDSTYNKEKERVRTIIDMQPIDSVKEFDNYHPNGGTPLYDAIGISLTKLNNAIGSNTEAMGIVTIITDGMENSSIMYNSAKVRALIEELTEKGWSFSYMGSMHDVKSVCDLLKIKNRISFSHNEVGNISSWELDRASRRRMFAELDNLYGASHGSLSCDERLLRKKRMSSEFIGNRVTPDYVDHLSPNEIFVFGSNINGVHTGGAAQIAMERFGAILGQGTGIQGQSYAIPTIVNKEQLELYIREFIVFAESHRDLQFLVTRIGCGTAGYTDKEIAPLFMDCIHLENVRLPKSFWDVYGIDASNFNH